MPIHTSISDLLKLCVKRTR